MIAIGIIHGNNNATCSTKEETVSRMEILTVIMELVLYDLAFLAMNA